MILDELVLHNIGVFRGRNSFALTPPAPDKPVVLVGALNGGGKTTLLDSIHLALFGPHARTAARRAASYPTHLQRLIHDGVPASEGAAVELAFHVHQEGVRRNYRVQRSWTVSGATLRERLDVLVDGRLDRPLTDRWAEQVEAFVPRGVAELFFFDGEKIETLAELDNAREMLRTAVGALLGLDLVDRLATDLTMVERQNRAKLAPPVIQKLLDGANRRVRDARIAATKAKQQAAGARSVAERAKSKLDQAEEQLRIEGGELLNRRRILENDERHLNKAVKENDTRAVDLASGVAPLRLVKQQLVEILDQAQREIAAVEHNHVSKVLDQRDHEIIQRLRSHDVQPRVLEDLATYLDDERRRRLDAAQVDPFVGLEPRDTSVLRSLLDHDFDGINALINNIVEERESLLQQLDDTIHTLAAVPETGALDELHAKREKALAEWTAASTSAAQTAAEAEDAEAAVAEAQRSLEKLLEKATDEVTHNDDLQRIIRHSERVRGTLAALRTEATRRNLHRIQTLVVEALQRLLRKERLVTELQIDPTSFNIELHGQNGTIILPQQLSAGERQLLAVSLLWGLAQASGRPLPVVIDTPLGRLDGIHRNHLITRYFPQASHQVILLSTDQEIDRDAWETIYPHVGHAYNLKYDSDKGHTVAWGGYFWPPPTT